MTGLLHEKEFSRKSFVKGGGALVVGFSLAGGVAGRASALLGPEAPNALPPSASGYTPNLASLDSWITVNADNTIALKTSQIEVGNGITTGFLQVLAEEMNTSMSQMHYGQYNTNSLDVVDTWVVGSTGGEGGSNAMSGTGPRVRAAGAYAYQQLLNLASAKLNVPVASLSVSGGVVTGGGSSISYGQLVGGQLLNFTIPSPAATSGLAQGVAPSKAVANYTLVGTSVPRIDIPEKVTAEYTYVQNVRIPGMLHGRLVRPRGQGAYPYNSDVPVSVDATSISHIPGAKVLQVGNFVGVTAPEEYNAIQAAAQLKVVWNTNPIFPGTGNLWEHYRALDAAGKTPPVLSMNVGNYNAALAAAAHTASGTFKYAYNGHMPIGPSCAVADVTASGATVWSNTQNVEGLVTDVVAALGPNYLPQNVRVLFYEGAGTFGNGNVAFDTGEAAAVMSQAAGKPVRLQMMRWDEHGWTHYGPAIMTDIAGGLDANGNLIAYQATQYTQPGTSLYTTRELVGSATGSNQNSIPALGAGTVNAENTSPWLKVSTAGNFPVQGFQLWGKSVPASGGILQSGALRAPGGPQTSFANEQLLDMLAHTAGMDPLNLRLQNMLTDSSNQRWSGVLQAVATAAGWVTHVPNSTPQSGNIRTGIGIANGHHGGSYAAIVAKVEVNLTTGKITAKHMYAAQDNGITINPGLIANQMSGNLVQGTSRALWEEVTFNTNNVTSLDWVTYPILRFQDSPNVTVVNVAQPTLPALGSGEPPIVAIAAAIANAAFDATGVRMWEAPMTPSRVRATLRAAGVS
jgi:CO/xanthine dehydrogenase Mo-binding subunit